MAELKCPECGADLTAKEAVSLCWNDVSDVGHMEIREGELVMVVTCTNFNTNDQAYCCAECGEMLNSDDLDELLDTEGSEIELICQPRSCETS